MARLTAAARKALPLSDYGVPSKAPGPGSYPMPNRKHAGLAKGMADKFAGPTVRAEVDRKADKKLGESKARPMDEHPKKRAARSDSHPNMRYR